MNDPAKQKGRAQLKALHATLPARRNATCDFLLRMNEEIDAKIKIRHVAARRTNRTENVSRPLCNGESMKSIEDRRSRLIIMRRGDKQNGGFFGIFPLLRELQHTIQSGKQRLFSRQRN